MHPAKVRATFVGRTQELDRLGSALDRTITRDSVTILCEGDAGIGKTRLVTEFAMRARQAGASVLVGGCVDAGSAGLPYGPVAEAMRTAVSSGALDPATLHDGVVDQLAILVPDIGRHARGAAPVDAPVGLGQVRLFEAILTAIHAIAADRPVVAIIEDVHWADRATLDLLAFLVHNLEGSRVLLIITVRTDGVPPDAPIASAIAELRRRPSVEQLLVDPLDRAAVGDQLRSILGEAPDDTLLDRVRHRSDGNPFFVEQLAWAHVDGEPDAVPSSLRDILLTKLSRLAPETLDLLGAASVAGQRVDEMFLATVLDVDESAVIAPLREAIRARLLVAEHGDRGTYGFRHALMAEAVAADLLEVERRALHARCADALVAERPRPGADRAQWAARVAHHRARSGDRMATIEASIEAALAAEAVAAHGDALAHYRRATQLLLPSDPIPTADWDRAELFERAGACAAVAGDPHEAARFTTAAIDALPHDADPFRRGRLLVRSSEYQWTSSDDRFLATLRLAADVIPADPPSAVRADALVALGFHHQYQGASAAARAAWEEARTTALAAAGAERELAMATICLASMDLDAGEIERADRALDGARQILRASGAPGDASAGWMDLVGVLGHAGRDEDAVSACREGLARARSYGYEAYYGGALVANGAECLVNLGPATPRRPSCWTRCPWAALVGSWTWGYGSRDRSYTSRSATPTSPWPSWTGWATRPTMATRRWVDTAPSSTPRPASRAAGSMTSRPSSGMRSPGRRPMCPTPTTEPLSSGRAFARRPSAPHERAHVVIASPCVPPRTTPRSGWPTSRRPSPLGRHGLPASSAPERSSPLPRPRQAVLAGHPDPAAWATAAERWTTVNGVFRRLYARIREAEALLDQGRAGRSTATACLVDAHHEACERGAGALVELARAIAARARVDLVEHAAATPAQVERRNGDARAPAEDARRSAMRAYGLTLREVEILGLLATGLTNREIGERLFISPKTAGVHVSNLLGKLGVSGRVQAATVAHHLGIATS